MLRPCSCSKLILITLCIFRFGTSFASAQSKTDPNEPLAKSDATVKNTAIIPVAKLEDDFYDWYARHEAILEEVAKNPADIIFIGDSITHLFGGRPISPKYSGQEVWDHYYSDRKALNLGFGWDRTQNVLWRIQQGELEGISPKAAVILIGTNNLKGTDNARVNTPEEVVEGVVAVCDAVRNKLPQCQIILLGLLPRAPESTYRDAINKINQALAVQAAERSIHFVDLTERFTEPDRSLNRSIMNDNVHPNSQGYEAIAASIEPLISRILGDKAIDSVKRLPYPKSEYINGIEFDWSTHKRGALGSDNFQLTWADDNHQYGAWGDGGGFSGSRVSIGVARIEGDGDNWKGFDVWYGDKDNALEAEFSGKSWGMMASQGMLYMWLSPDVPKGQTQRDQYAYVELLRSPDHGSTWQKAPWAFTKDQRLSTPTFLNFGKDNNGARDEYIYSYFIDPLGHYQPNDKLNVKKPGKIYLARVERNELWNGPEAYEWYSGSNHDYTKTQWGDMSRKQPVFEDPNGVGWCLSATYIRGLDRYFLCTEHTESHRGLLGIFEASTPWGPWKTVEYFVESDPFGGNRLGDPLPWKRNVFFIAFSPKWQSPDGAAFTLTFTGGGRGKDNDSFNTIEGSIQIVSDRK